MIFRLANIQELDVIDMMYQGIVAHMNQNKICIWNEYYPFECFEEDIQKQRLYVLEEAGTILASCALLEHNEAEGIMEWEHKGAKALYIDRLGVNVDYQKRGCGSLLIKNVLQYAMEREFDYLRLLVVDINTPAISLYEKNGFQRTKDIYEERITDTVILTEYGYEKKCRIKTGNGEDTDEYQSI